MEELYTHRRIAEPVPPKEHNISEACVCIQKHLQIYIYVSTHVYYVCTSTHMPA